MGQNNSLNNKTSELEVNGAYSLPTVDGTSGQAMVTDGAGTVSWGSSIPGEVVQIQYNTYATFTDVTGVGNLIPQDDTIPQSGEGFEVLTQAITPTNASNLLVITCSFPARSTDGTIALFQDATANALTATAFGSTWMETHLLEHIMLAGTTSATTFKIRVGGSGGGSHIYINGNGAARKYGGVCKVILKITEYAV